MLDPSRSQQPVSLSPDDPTARRRRERDENSQNRDKETSGSGCQISRTDWQDRSGTRTWPTTRRSRPTDGQQQRRRLGLRGNGENRTFVVDVRSSACSRICLQQEQRWRQRGAKARHRLRSSSPTSSSSLSPSSSSPLPACTTRTRTRASSPAPAPAPLRSGASSSPPTTRTLSLFTSSLRSSLLPRVRLLSLLAALLCLLMCFRSCVAAKDSSSGSLSSAAQKASLVTINNKEDVCHNFTVGDRNKGEFYSPRFPNDYPNNTECVAVLVAPFGSYIKVEFRDSFSLEESETCEYDRLEIRNGQFGYSDLIDVICGHTFPPEISSSDNYLWLRFKSDESIEYSGFRAVYHFIPLPTTRPEPPACYFEKTGASGLIKFTEIPETVFEYYHLFKTPIECIWNITVQPGWHMYINFDHYELARPNGCDVNYIDIYESVLSEEKRKARFCGTATEPQRSDGNVINIRFHVKEGILDVNAEKRGFRFEILFTAFRTNEKEKCNKNTEFDCDDGTCIAASLKCNNEDNCKYRYDEDEKTTCFEGGKGVLILTSEHMIVILVVFAALVVGMCTSIFVSCWGKIQERRQRELEYKLRRSRETSVEAGLDRAMTVQSLDKNMMALVSGSGMIGSHTMAHASSEYSGQHHPLLSSHNLPVGRSHTPVLPAHHAHALPAQHHRSHPKLAGLASVGSSGDPVLIREEEEDGEEGDVDEEDEEMRGNEGCNVCYESDLQQQQQQQQQQHHHSTASSAQHLHDRRVLPQQQHEVDDEDDDQYSTDTPPQIISVNCPLYHQHQHQQQQHHQQHLQQQQSHHKSHVSIHSSSQQNIYQRDRSDSDDLRDIPPPPPPPALSHLRGRVNVLR